MEIFDDDGDSTAPPHLLSPSGETLSEPSGSPRTPHDRHDDEAAATVPAPTSTAAATTDTAYATPCTVCLPGGGVFGRWRRRRAGRARRGTGGSSDDSVISSADPAASISSGGMASGKVSGSSRRRPWRAGSGKKEPGSAPPSTAAADKVAGESKSTAKALTLGEAEALATRDWGGGSGGSESAKDIWKELVPIGSGGKAGAGRGAVGGGGGSGGSWGGTGPAVRLRLRFVPLWDCLAVSVVPAVGVVRVGVIVMGSTVL